MQSFLVFSSLEQLTTSSLPCPQILLTPKFEIVSNNSYVDDGEEILRSRKSSFSVRVWCWYGGERVQSSTMAAGNQNQKEMPQILRTQLALAVRSIQWSYAIFWSLSSRRPGTLEWCEGYYNGDIKTRKTVQASEVNMDQLGLQRSDHLRELYESLSLGETRAQAKRPTAALSPEDLTDAEWYFLVCMSFVFNTDQGLPGRTLAKNKMIWLCNAHRADTKVFSRSLLAKSASVKTVVCFPHFGGVVELGTTELVQEDANLIQHISSFLESPSMILPEIPNHVFDSSSNDANVLEDGLDQLLEDPFMELYSPNNSSDEFADNLLREESDLVEGVDVEAAQMQSWPLRDDAVSNCLNNSVNSSDCVSQTQDEGEPETIIPLSDGKKKAKKRCMHEIQECSQKKTSEFQGNDIHYHSVLSNLLKSSYQLILGPYIRNSTSRESSFICWRRDVNPVALIGTPQKLLKRVLFEVATMHQGCGAESAKHESCRAEPKKEVDEIDRNHVLSERKRREKINERFTILGSLVPSGGKVDKVSVLDHTIEYLRELERKVEELESYKETMETGSTTHSKSQDAIEMTSDNYGNDNSKKAVTNKRKASQKDKRGPENCKVRLRDSTIDNIYVSVSEKEVLIEIKCSWKENVLLQVMESLSKIRVEAQTVKSSTTDGSLSIAVNAKCKGLDSPSAVGIKQALQKAINKC